MYQEDDAVVSHSYSGVPPANVSKSLDGSFTIAVRLTVMLLHSSAENFTVPLAAPKASGAAMLTVCSSPAGTETEVGAVKPPVVSIFTVRSTEPLFLIVMFFSVLASTSPKSKASPSL